MVARRRHRAMSAVGTARPRCGRWILMAVLLTAGCGVLAAGGTGQDHTILAGVQRFMLSYSGVFALIALTAAVAAGPVATDNIVMPPARRVVSRPRIARCRWPRWASWPLMSAGDPGAPLARARAVVPFRAGGDAVHRPRLACVRLVLLIFGTGVARRRFAVHLPADLARHPCRRLPAMAAGHRHGLRAAARPAIVDWSYGAPRQSRSRRRSGRSAPPGTEGRRLPIRCSIAPGSLPRTTRLLPRFTRLSRAPGCRSRRCLRTGPCRARSSTAAPVTTARTAEASTRRARTTEASTRRARTTQASTTSHHGSQPSGARHEAEPR